MVRLRGWIQCLLDKLSRPRDRLSHARRETSQCLKYYLLAGIFVMHFSHGSQANWNRCLGSGSWCLSYLILLIEVSSLPLQCTERESWDCWWMMADPIWKSIFSVPDGCCLLHMRTKYQLQGTSRFDMSNGLKRSRSESLRNGTQSKFSKLAFLDGPFFGDWPWTCCKSGRLFDHHNPRTYQLSTSEPAKRLPTSKPLFHRIGELQLIAHESDEACYIRAAQQSHAQHFSQISIGGLILVKVCKEEGTLTTQMCGNMRPHMLVSSVAKGHQGGQEPRLSRKRRCCHVPIETCNIAPA